MKRGCFIVLLLLFLCLLPGAGADAAGEEGTGQNWVQQMGGQVDTQPLDSYWKELTSEYGAYLQGGSSPRLLDAIRAEGFNFQGVLRGLFQFFFHELVTNAKLLGMILVLAVLSALLETMQSAFERQAVAKIAYAVVYMVLFLLAVRSFMTASGYAKTAISQMSDFMLASIPLLLTLLASLGSLGSAAMLHPLIVFTVQSVGHLINYLIFPLIFFATLLSLISTLSERYKVTELAALLRSTAVALLGLFFSVFLGVMAVRGSMGAIADGVTLRAAKFASSTFVPVVGKMFADAADTVAGASLLVKNTVGLAGMVVLLLMAAFPALKIISLAVIYNLSAALLQPLGHSPVITCLAAIGKALTLVFAALATVGFMFFLAVTMILAAGNLAVMMR